MAPFGVFRVTVRVSPAGSAGGWLVGQSPVAGDPPGADDPPGIVEPVGAVDAPALLDAPAAADAPGEAEAIAPPPPSGLNTRMSAMTATTVTAPPISQAAPGRLVDVVVARTAVRFVGGRVPDGFGLDAFGGCRCEPRRRFPFDESGTVPPDRVHHAAAATAAG
jgi:hypothetical protein